MKKLLKIAGAATAALLLLAAAAAAFVAYGLPRRAPPSSVHVAMTPERISRGRYLFEAVMDCNGCHSVRDFNRFGGPVLPHGKGAGQVMPVKGLPGRIVVPNITPDKETGIGAWTDGEKIRAIREGIGRDGQPLFPMMPYEVYRSLSDDDAAALVAYLNSLEPVRNPLPRSAVAFPVSALMRLAPRPAGAVQPPDRQDPVVYGKYLFTIGGCAHCHTPGEGQKDESKLLAGGARFELDNGLVVVSANITPDEETGIGRWTEQYFLDRFRQPRNYVEHGSPLVGPEQFTLMPWLSLSQLTDDDLRALYRYLRTQQPISNRIVTHPAPMQLTKR